MYLKQKHSIQVLALFLLTTGIVWAQLPSNVYCFDSKKEGRSVHHELKVSADYLILTQYETAPAKFIKTMGGYYTAQDGILKVALEFNSNREIDSITELNIPYTLSDQLLVLNIGTEMHFKASNAKQQDLDGQWLFATRGPDTGQERRGEQNTRKTLKFLLNGRFQWIAYDIEGFQFKGTGGGSYTASDGQYTEHIEYFSRDNSRVGASLQFQYEQKENDWHHRGKNSKGAPMYEIWGKRFVDQ